MPQPSEPEQSSSSEEDKVVLRTEKDVVEYLKQFGVHPEELARALLESGESLPEKERSGLARLAPWADHRGVEDDASDDSARGK